MQSSLNIINENLNQQGLEISTEKTKAMFFTRQQKKNIVQPNLSLKNSHIENVNTFKFLGIYFDSKLKWSPHVDYLCSKTIKNVNIIRMLSNSTYGADRESLIKIHESVTTSVLNYGSLIMTNLTKRDEQKLNTIHIKSLKYAIGAFVTSPNLSVEAEAGVLPLRYRRKMQLAKFGCKIKSNNQHIMHTALIDESKDAKYSKINNPPISYILRQELKMLNIDKNTKFVTNNESHKPPWNRQKIKIDLSLTKFNKQTTSHEIIKQSFNEKLNNYRGKSYEEIYTDGSKNNDQYGSAVVTRNNKYKFKCHNYCSVFTTELFAIKKALELRETTKTIIYTDSLSAVHAIMNNKNKNPLVQQIQNDLNSNNKTTILCWIPSHVGIVGNELADKCAKEAINGNFHQILKLYHQILTNI